MLQVGIDDYTASTKRAMTNKYIDLFLYYL